MIWAVVALLFLPVATPAVTRTASFPWSPIERTADSHRLLTTQDAFAVVPAAGDTVSTAVMNLYNNRTAGALALATGPFSIDIHTGVVVICDGVHIHVYDTSGSTLRLETATVSSACTSVDAWRGDIYALLANGNVVNVILSTSSVSVAQSYAISANITANINVSASDILATKTDFVLRPTFLEPAIVGNTSIDYQERLTGNATGGALVVLRGAGDIEIVHTPATQQGSLAHHPTEDSACVRTEDITEAHEVGCYEAYTAVASSAWAPGGGLWVLSLIATAVWALFQ